MTRSVWLSDTSVTTSAKKGDPPPQDGRLTREIRVSDGPDRAGGRAIRTVAFPERRFPPGGGLAEYRAARKQGARAFTLWADAHRTQVFAQVVTKSAAKGGPATYEVLGAEGEPLALITREPALRGGRVRSRWTVQQAGAQPVVGLKGRPFWWGVWWLLFPVQLVIVAGSLVAGSGDVARTPRRTKWRAGDRVVLDFRSGADDNFELDVEEEGWDERVTASLLALLDSHEGWLGSPWDTE
ncbi:hypothetical protein ACFV1F_13310 [Streptomyces sp. NPDC059590]|uniref:hypothetical protein n=1 Tax=Streptomyces sp. NPDC059590 TaxID=3346877 RepID=UPI0036A6F1D4